MINEEEKQFLKTLSRGKRVFERTIQRMDPSVSVIPGTYVRTFVWLGKGRHLYIYIYISSMVPSETEFSIYAISQVVKRACNFTIFGSQVIVSSSALFMYDTTWFVRPLVVGGACTLDKKVYNFIKYYNGQLITMETILWGKLQEIMDL